MEKTPFWDNFAVFTLKFTFFCQFSVKNDSIFFQIDEYPDAFAKLHERAVVDSTVSSNRIEGVETSEKRIKELFIKLIMWGWIKEI